MFCISAVLGVFAHHINVLNFEFVGGMSFGMAVFDKFKHFGIFIAFLI
jgi:hypothetical protein